MKRPEPWYWEKRKGWYIQINKVQTKLGRDLDPKRDKAGKPVAPPAVMREYHRLMASSNLTNDSERDRATVGEVCEAYLAVKSRLSDSAYRTLVSFLKALCGPYLRRRFRALRVADIEQLAEAHEAWNENSKHAFAAKIKTMFRWAKDAGYLEFDPLAGWAIPWVEKGREREMTDDEYRAVLDMAHDLEFKQVLGFMRGTGCRPGEARKITAAHVHPEKPIITLAPSEHKTGKRTRKPKLIYMPKDVEQMVRVLMVQHPTGPLFRNSRAGKKGGRFGIGIGWAADTIAARFRVYRRKLSLGEEVVPYLIRHATLTRLLDGGTSLHHTMVIAGHTTPSQLMKTYYHADQGLLLDAVEQAHKAKPKKKPKSPDA